MSMSKKDVLYELKLIWIETTPEHPARNILQDELFNMLSSVTDDKRLLLDFEDLLVEFYCIGERNGFFSGVETFRRLMEE